MRNVHKIDTRLVAIPREAQQDDCGLKYCESIQTVLSSQTETTNWKNDRTSFAFKFDEMTVKLVKDDVETLAVGYYFDFPAQTDAVGFVIDWRQNPYGKFKIKIEWELGGVSGWFWYAEIRHLPWTCENSRNTVRLFIHLDDFVRKQGINYKGSGFYGTVRFSGIFGYMQPNYDTENIIYSDRVNHKVRNEAIRSYEMYTDQLTYSMTRLLDEDVLLTANNILVTDHSDVNHNQDFRDFPVILSDSESPQYEYSDGITASIKAVFNEKVAVSESRYSSDINSALPIVQTVITTTPDATIEVNGNTFGTVASGGMIDIPVVNGGSNSVGTIDDGQVVIGDSSVFINGTQVGDVVAEDTLSISVELDGALAGTWNANTQTWEVDSIPCPTIDLTVNSEPFLSGLTSNTNIGLVDQDGNDLDFTVDGNDLVVENADIILISGTSQLMRTGQNTSYATGDDGALKKGRGLNTLISPPLHADGSPTINTTTNRFTDELGGQTYTNGIMIDWGTWDALTAKVLGYRRTPAPSDVTWGVAMSTCLGLSIGIFTSGWRLTNLFELLNLARYEPGVNKFNWSPLNYNVAVNLWTSTNNSTNAFVVNHLGWANENPKGNSGRFFACRDFTAVGMILI